MPNGLKLFIMGAPRSGTSITYYAAREVLKLAGPGESHVVPIFAQMMHQFFQYVTGFKGTAEKPGPLAGELDPRSLRVAMQAHLRAFYQSKFKDDGFVDKTPGAEALTSALFVAETFPEAKLLATQRTGIEVVQSFQIKFEAGFEEACTAWANCMTALQRATKLVPQMLVIDQFDLTNAPDDIGRRIAGHVERPEVAGELTAFFRERRTDKTSAHDWRTRMTLDQTTWTDEQKRVFRAICGPMMEANSYPM